MKSWLLLSLFLVAISTARGQAPGRDDSPIEAARNIIEAARYCFLITLDRSGQPQARLMEPFPPEADMAVWMGTDRRTRKIQQIRGNPRATLACYNAKGPDYVTLIGQVRIVEDPRQRRRYWRPEWAAFFPSGPEGGNYVLLQFTPVRIELISNTHKIAVAPASLRPAILERRGSSWRLAPGKQ